MDMLALCMEMIDKVCGIPRGHMMFTTPRNIRRVFCPIEGCSEHFELGKRGGESNRVSLSDHLWHDHKITILSEHLYYLRIAKVDVLDYGTITIDTWKDAAAEHHRSCSVRQGKGGMYLSMSKSNEADLAVAHYENRKCAEIVARTYHAFLRALEEYGTLSAEDAMVIGYSLFRNVTVRPLERMSNDPQALRREIAQYMAELIEAPEDDGTLN